MDGIEVTRRVREFVGPNTTIIIITAYDWSSIEQKRLEKPEPTHSFQNLYFASTHFIIRC